MWLKGSLILFIVHCKFASRVLLFQDALMFWNTIALCYNNQFVASQNRVLSPKIWAVCEEVVKVLSLIIFGFVLNQICGHWCVACWCLIIYHIHLLGHPWRVGLLNYYWQPYWKECVWIWIEGIHGSNASSSTCYFLSTFFWEEKNHNMLVLMFDPRVQKHAISYHVLGLWKCCCNGC